ncbi:hypothetical protein J3U21_01795 [Gilliamella sp. B2776]|uniref:tight adherence pilus pseudopilin TadF n=1 Tax=unclassified Gilliamella TaxID=2685620 RepID=UPI00226A4142|nr:MULTISPECIES: tight adherence pilus pseudopilin TadF [unclassified Gilliamella]MCX8649064.1 hypothetical protein [Gilliamella sp. B2779]MCX8653060.1 hypothetical protein [Gilliamella sp. B2737]MCX8655320.1 hypothetical protein [Gilliamella sp. B2894]MCX8664803.1 hypothetical protein [Gilliamella sp. B2887]MCX8690876.1 hypothetical protein [Gilliamella sp. B2776]
MKDSKNFFHNKDGALSIEFAFCFILFSLIVFIIYDVYTTIMLQNKIERANYTVASVFRERSTLYKDKVKRAGEVLSAGLCANRNACYISSELFDSQQVNEMSKLASSLLNNREVALQIEALFILQDPDNIEDLEKAKLVTYGKKILSCSKGTCGNNSIKSYFNSLPAMDDPSNNYQQLAPYAQKFVDSSNMLSGRWIPLYRVSMCIVNEDSLFLNLVNHTGQSSDGIVPNLCSNVVVLSRCNNSRICPTYY